MSDKKNFVILLIVMVVLIGGAYLLYNALGDEFRGPGLVVQENSGASSESVSESFSENDRESVAASGADAIKDKESVGGSQASSGNQSESDSGAPGGQESEQQVEPAPDFKVYDAEGNAVRLSDFRGKPVIVNFWASWCGPCKSEMPDFQELYDVYGSDIHFVMVNMTDGARETMESASEFVGKSGYTFPVYYDTDLDATYTYGVYSIPTTFFYDEAGNVIAYGQGALDKETILRGIGMIFALDE